MADMDNPNGVVRSGKSDKGITLAGEQYENLPLSDGNIEDRRGDDDHATEANTARTMASTRTRMAVKGRQRY